MRYRQLGKTGLTTSEISLGAARGMKNDRKAFTETVHAAIDAGINFVDTAESYEDGDSERALGEALTGHPDVLVETKYRPYDSHLPDAAYTGTPAKLIASAEASMKRLKRDQIDILLGHGIRTLKTYDKFMNDGCYDAMVKLRDEGKVRFIGISELSEADGTHEILKKAIPESAFDVVMLTVNFLLQTAVNSILPLCREHDVGTVIMMPLNQASRSSGLVSMPAALECIRRHVKKGNLPSRPPYTEPGLLDFLAPLSVPETGLRYVLAQDVSTCCVGMSTPKRVADNCRAVDPPYLDDHRLSRIRDLFGGITWQVR